MTPADQWASIVKVLTAHGYAITGMWQTPPMIEMKRPGGYHPIFIDTTLAAVFDAYYQEGFKYGFERGAYEEQQQEDVEPGDIVRLDPSTKVT